MDRRTFLATSGATTIAVGIDRAVAKSAAQGDAALTATLDTVFADNIVHNPEDATSLGLDKGINAALKSDRKSVV